MNPSKKDIEAFILGHYTPYDGDSSFLAPPTSRTRRLWETCEELLKEEARQGGVKGIDVQSLSGILSFAPGYIDRKNEVIVGLQTDEPLKRMVNPFGGLRLAKKACEAYGCHLSGDVEKLYFKYRKSHNDGVFHAYTGDMLKARRSGVITGLPDAYGRGRIIGDYRRVALYGTDTLIQGKQEDLEALANEEMSEENIRLREEAYEQIQALKELAALGAAYGFDIKKHAVNAFEAVQWTYLAFLGAVRETNGAANSLGRLNTFFDIYIEKDICNGLLDEAGAQELIDQLVIKLRLVRHLRTPEYNELFAGDPVWLTEALGGMSSSGRHQVTKTAYRFLHTLVNLGPAPEPNLTVLWSERLPDPFKSYCTQISIETSAIQYENDDLMRPVFGSDYGISCCVSAMDIGRDMQFFGARCNLPKLLLLALNGGRDEFTGEQIGPAGAPCPPGPLSFDWVMESFYRYQAWLAALYVDTLNIIHHMHDKYAYERLMMALHDTRVHRFMAFGIAGLSVVCDSLSAIKYARVTPLKNEDGLVTDFIIKGDFPKYGNDDDRADSLAVVLAHSFLQDLKARRAYRNAEHTLSILTITSNVVYGKKTGATPDGRKKGEPFAPGANPMHGRDKKGALAVLNTVAKLPYETCRDGISLTLSLTPPSLGRESRQRTANLAALLDGYFAKGGHHLNINVLDRKLLLEAIESPERYPWLTIRVSGYAVHFNKLTEAQKKEVLARSFHDGM